LRSIAALHKINAMHNVFNEIFENRAADPIEAARRNMDPKLRARFYDQAKIGEMPDGFCVLLDGRPVQTPAHRPLSAPVRDLAAALAAEWAAQRHVIDPAKMPLTRLANAIIDGVVTAPGPVAEKIKKYLGSDLLFYRAAGPQGLIARQALHWDPVIEWAHQAFGARFVLAQGVVHVQQPAAAIAAVLMDVRAGGKIADLWRLGALSAVTTLTGSALLALALAAGRLSVEAIWAAAHVDEDWNMELWGRDELALKRRAACFAELQAAATALEMVR
jgi:chaperone required for assembly of F1-ATPase